MNDVIMTVEQSAEYLQLSRDTLYRYAQSGKVPAMRIGKHWRFSRTALGAWVRGAANPSGASPAAEALVPSPTAFSENTTDAAVSTPASVGPLHVLIVDDDVSVRKLLSVWVGKMGHRVTLAKSGQGAIALLKETSFDLVLLDLFLGDMTGDKVLAQVPLANPPAVVMITGMPDSDIMDVAIQYPVAYALTKPFSKADVECVVRMFGEESNRLPD